MSRVPLGVAVATLAAAATALGPTSEAAWACSCGRVSPADALRHYDAAFVGLLITQRRLEHVIDPVTGGPSAISTFRVERVVKGMLPARLGVISPSGGSSCGVEVLRGQSRRFGVFLDRRRGRWHSHLCLQYQADEMPASLAGARVFGSRPGEQADDRDARVVAAIVAAIVAVGAAGTALFLRRRGG